MEEPVIATLPVYIALGLHILAGTTKPWSEIKQFLETKRLSLVLQTRQHGHTQRLEVEPTRKEHFPLNSRRSGRACLPVVFSIFLQSSNQLRQIDQTFCQAASRQTLVLVEAPFLTLLLHGDLHTVGVYSRLLDLGSRNLVIG